MSTMSSAEPDFEWDACLPICYRWAAHHKWFKPKKITYRSQHSADAGHLLQRAAVCLQRRDVGADPECAGGLCADYRGERRRARQLERVAAARAVHVAVSQCGR